jgi:hypothetical protein
MRCARALPMNQLMPAVGSLDPPGATQCRVDLLLRMSDRTPVKALRMPDTPSIIKSPDVVRGPR